MLVGKMEVLSMFYNNCTKKDIFDILGISGREDSYTDLIYSVFEISKLFKENLLKKFFEGNGNIEKLNMKIRSCYFTPEGSRKKIIPDIILYNDNKIVIIEVKIFSGEGENQLERYDKGLNEIKSQLGLSNDIKVDKFYLTLDKYNNLGGGFNSIVWKEFIDLIPNDDFDNDIIKICINCFKERVNEYASYSNNEVHISDSDNFKDIYNWYHFVSYEKILTQIFKEEIGNKQYIWDIWEGWENGENCYAASIQVYCKDSWKSKNEIKFKDIDNDDIDKEVIDKDLISVKSNYDIHYEIKIIGKNKIEFRIDYHTNPYLTSNDIKVYELYHLYDDRKKIIQNWKEHYRNEDGTVSRAQGKALYVYKKTYEIKDEWTVNDFKNVIYESIYNNEDKVNYLLSVINDFN